MSSPERTLLANLPGEIDAVLGALAADDGDDVVEEPAAPAPGAVPAFPAAEGAAAVPPSLRRLFPPAYTRDDDAERAYVETVRPALLEHHRRALQTLSTTATAKRLDAEQIEEWMTALNDIRLVLGTVLGVDEGSEPPAAGMSQQMLYYYYLSGLETELVDFLSGWLPEPIPGADDSVPTDPWGEPLGGLRWDGTPQPTEGP